MLECDSLCKKKTNYSKINVSFCIYIKKPPFALISKQEAMYETNYSDNQSSLILRIKQSKIIDTYNFGTDKKMLIKPTTTFSRKNSLYNLSWPCLSIL